MFSVRFKTVAGEEQITRGAKTFDGLRPVVFVPGTLGRTLGTRRARVPPGVEQNPKESARNSAKPNLFVYGPQLLPRYAKTVQGGLSRLSRLSRYFFATWLQTGV
jgi:hypothetical protein